MTHISFRYDPEGPMILNDVSLRVGPGEFAAFVGPSGAGKSTILRPLLGFETAETGSIYYNGQDFKGPYAQKIKEADGRGHTEQPGSFRGAYSIISSALPL